MGIDIEDNVYDIAIGLACKALEKNNGKAARLKSVHCLSDNNGVPGVKLTVELSRAFVQSVKELAQQEDNNTH